MRKLPFDKEKLEEIAKKYPTPFHIYDAEAIRENARRLLKAFSSNKGFLLLDLLLIFTGLRPRRT